MSRTTTITDWPLLTRGSCEHATITLQYLLRANGHNVPLNGTFGMTLERAVRAFQKRKQLAVDGSVGPQTWGALVVTVQRGNRGVAVCAVQNELNLRQRAGTTGGVTADGVFGSETDRAVRAVQKDLGLLVDGVVGPKTWAALAGGMLLG